jgi:epoxyqueuosine reductase
VTSIPLTIRLKQCARALGCDLVGIAPVQDPPHGEAFAAWLRRGHHGTMAYLARTAGQRLHPAALLPWARSVVAVAVGYDNPEPPGLEPDGPRGRIARYARGADYHQALEEMLAGLLNVLRREAGRDVMGRAFVDAGPMPDREIAAAAGLGWFGKNTNILSAGLGSYFVLGELFVDVELEPDRPTRNRCGACRLCLEACPTQAFAAPYVLDARRCIAYLTIELKGAIPPELRPLIGAHIFGCDICQAICPYNAKRRPSRHPAFLSREDREAPALISLLDLTDAEFRTRFFGSPILRAKRRGLLRNVCVALGNLGRPEAVPALGRALAEDPEPLVRAHAAWALGRIGQPAAVLELRSAAERETSSEVREEIRNALGAA